VLSQSSSDILKASGQVSEKQLLRLNFSAGNSIQLALIAGSSSKDRIVIVVNEPKRPNNSDMVTDT
jgi:hypothetical protein